MAVSHADLAEDVLIIVVGFVLLIWGAIDYGYGIVLGLGLGMFCFGINQGRKDLNRYRNQQ